MSLVITDSIAWTLFRSSAVIASSTNRLNSRPSPARDDPTNAHVTGGPTRTVTVTVVAATSVAK